MTNNEKEHLDKIIKRLKKNIEDLLDLSKDEHEALIRAHYLIHRQICSTKCDPVCLFARKTLNKRTKKR